MSKRKPNKQHHKYKPKPRNVKPKPSAQDIVHFGVMQREKHSKYFRHLHSE